jgi:hypothetical protein
MEVEKALAILEFHPQHNAVPLAKLLKSAINNWEQKNNGASAADSSGDVIGGKSSTGDPTGSTAESRSDNISNSNNNSDNNINSNCKTKAMAISITIAMSIKKQYL